MCVFLLPFSEVELGKIIQKYNWKRAGYVVTTKIYWSMKSDERGLSRKHIIESVKASLQRLRLPYVDIVIIYKADPMCPMEGTYIHVCACVCVYMEIMRCKYRNNNNDILSVVPNCRILSFQIEPRIRIDLNFIIRCAQIQTE